MLPLSVRLVSNKLTFVIFYLGFAACAGNFGGSEHSRATQVTAIAMVASTVCDYGGTYHYSSAGWHNAHEVGVPAAMVMGDKPSALVVSAYFAGTVATVLGVGQLLPQRWRPWLYASVAAVEIVTSVATTAGDKAAPVCGF
jgi:hypothetical protein